jgi:aspartyl/asparaginyl-tRNA synthetase
MKDTLIYHELVQKMRAFFLAKGFREVPTQSRLSILAACENPHSVKTFEYSGLIWPLPQTGQMWLEYELLKNPEWDGVFCISTSYREEKNPIEGRHSLIFPMFEVETKGNMFDMINLQDQLLDWLGFEKPICLDYDFLCEKYNTDIIEHEHETKIWEDIGNSISLQNFPLRTNPFWNMKRSDNGKFNKVDIILYGQETIGSAERSCDPDSMREMFYTIENGNYAKKLFELFGVNRVEKELEEFLALNFFSRFGWGCGLTRLERAYKLNNEKN